jgi:succinoglycan biosynthesis transport protein ExoP
MDLWPYIVPLRKWWFLIVVATLLAAVSSFLAIRNQPPVYNARTTLLIGRTIFDPNPSSNEIYLNQQLGNLYSDIANREPVRDATMKALGLTWLPQYVVRPMANSQFIEIIVTDSDPQRAFRVADELARQLVNLSPGSSQSEGQARREFVQAQLDEFQKNIVDTENQIAQKQASLGSLTSAHDIAQAQDQIQTLQTKLNLLQTNYTTLLASSQGGATNILQVIEPASVPTKPVGPSKLLIVLIAAAIGLVTSSGTAYLLEMLDDTIKTPEDVTRLLGLPVVGYFAEAGKKFEESPYVALHPRSVLAEAYRSLRASLEADKGSQPMKVLLVTSPDAADGKTSVAVNLAVSIMHSGKKVLLVDADIRKPNIHKYLNVENNKGFGEVLNGELDVRAVMQRWDKGDLYVVTAGRRLDVLDELLLPEKIERALNDLRYLADVVILDSSPFIVSDAMTMAPFVDGVLVVIRPGHTHRKMVKLMAERINRMGGNILGVALNRIPLSQIGFYGEYRHYSPYYFSKYYGENGNGVDNNHHKEEAAKIRIASEGSSGRRRRNNIRQKSDQELSEKEGE